MSVPAREFDQETGLYYYRARYYDPQPGRFLSEDPIKFQGGTNFYRYSLNSPVTFSDPFGLRTICMLAGPVGTRNLVCWEDKKVHTDAVLGEYLSQPSQPNVSDEIKDAYANYRQCRGRVNITVGSKACKPGKATDPRFKDDFGLNADPKYNVTVSIDLKRLETVWNKIH
jgi:RHS repeat-associated protein